MREALLSFRCAQDPDIESFLHTKAIEFLDRGLCSIYLLLNGELFESGTLFVEAYFTLSHKSLIAERVALFFTHSHIDFLLSK